MAYHTWFICFTRILGLGLLGNNERHYGTSRRVIFLLKGIIVVLTQKNRFMALAGVSVGLAFGPAGIHARFSQPKERVAVVEGLQLFVGHCF